jgi:hypothetical protein
LGGLFMFSAVPFCWRRIGALPRPPLYEPEM